MSVEQRLVELGLELPAPPAPAAGRHARSAVGVASLPFGIPVEIELIVEVGD